jgi:hypothetical protein
MRRTRGERRAISEHLLFELQMMFLMADRLRRHLSGEYVLPGDIKTACIESLVVHVRSLGEFIWGSPHDEHPHDALASDFFPDGEWEERGNASRSRPYATLPRAPVARSLTCRTGGSACPRRRGSGSSTSSLV